MKLKKWIRRLAYVLVGLGLLAIVIYFAAQNYARKKVVAAIEEIVGGPVEVDEVRIGREQIEVRGLRAYESDAGKTAWLTIDKAVFGLSLGDALGGETVPESASLEGASVLLRFDENGKLIRKFNFPRQTGDLRLKQVDIVAAKLEIHQRERTPLIVRQIDGQILVTSKDILFQAVGDSLDARWNIDARVDAASSATRCLLKTDRLRLSTDELTTLPFFPAGVGQDVRARGTTPVNLALQINEQRELAYRLELSLSEFDFEHPGARLSVTDAQGSFVLQKDLITFTEFRGNLAHGRLSSDGQLRLRDEVWRGRVQGKIDDVPLANLPRDWELPNDLRGTLTGQGVLNVEVADSYVEIRGSASATIEEPQLAGISTQPIAVAVEITKLRKSVGAQLTLDGAATVDVEIRDVELVELLEAAEIDSNQFEDLSGPISIQAALQIPLATAADLKTYRVNGELASRQIQFDGIALDDVQANLEIREGIASLRDLKTRIAESGQVQGSITIEVQPPGNIAADLVFARLPVSLIEKRFGTPEASVDGFVAGDLRLNVPIKHWKNLEMWKASGRIQSSELSLNKLRMATVEANFDISQGRLAVMNGSAYWDGLTIEAAGNVHLKRPYAYSFTAAVRGLDVQTAADFADIEVPIEVSGQANVKGKVAGELESRSWTATGDANLDNLRVEKFVIESPIAQWQANAEQLLITSAEAKMFGGNMELTAEIPFAAERSTKVAGTFSGFDSQIFKQHLPDSPLALSGSTSGEFTLTGIEHLETASGSLKIRDLTGEVYGVFVEGVAVDLSLLRQSVDLKAKGMALGGTVSLATKMKFKELKSEDFAIAARVSAEGILLSRIWQRIGPQLQVAPPEGAANLQLDLELAGPSRKPTGTGQLEVRDVRWNRKQVAARVTTSISMLSDSVILRDLTFDYGGGRVSSTVAFRWDEIGSGSYDLVAEKVALRALLVAFPDVARDVQGSVDAAFRGRFASRKLDGAGKVQVSSGRVAGLPVRSFNSAVNGGFDLASGRGTAEIRLTRAEVSNGRTTGNLSIQWGRRLTLKGKANVVDMDLRPLAAATAFSDQLTGRLSGNINFQGRNVRSPQDISGTYDLHVANSQLLRLPVLSALTNVAGIGSSSSTFSDTQIKGRMNRGVIYVDRMTMVAARIHMFIQGKITTRGQLDLEVTADTAEILAVGVVAGIIRPLDWLRRRLIFLHIGGTVRSPVVLPQTEKFIQQEVLLFFLPFVPR